MWTKINELEKRVANGEMNNAANGRLFAGANLVITPSEPEGKNYSENTVVLVTKHSKEISNLIYAFRDSFSDYMDGCTKYFYYENIGYALKRAQESKGDDLNELYKAFFAMLRRMALSNMQNNSLAGRRWIVW